MHAAANARLRADPRQLSSLAPLSGLSSARLRELAELLVVEHAEHGSDPMQGRTDSGDSIFLLRGELLLAFAAGGTQVIVGGSEDARTPLNNPSVPLARTKAITDVELLVIDNEVLDVLVTWDQVAAGEQSAGDGSAHRDWRQISGMLSLTSLRHGVFSQMPAAHIDELLGRFERVAARRGDVVIREGDDGDYYYVLESGRCQVERMVGGVQMPLAELKSGDAFGEEALVSEAKRNATVVMTADGELLRLGSKDFNELLKQPLLNRISYAEARDRVARGALWLDVRYPSEYQYDKLPGAINVPLAEVRNMGAVLDKSREYVVYCQSGRRSSAAAFLFAQRGFKTWLLEGGLWGVDRQG